MFENKSEVVISSSISNYFLCHVEDNKVSFLIKKVSFLNCITDQK